jgi:hypothetical protein
MCITTYGAHEVCRRLVRLEVQPDVHDLAHQNYDDTEVYMVVVLCGCCLLQPQYGFRLSKPGILEAWGLPSKERGCHSNSCNAYGGANWLFHKKDRP